MMGIRTAAADEARVKVGWDLTGSGNGAGRAPLDTLKTKGILGKGKRRETEAEKSNKGRAK